MKPSQRALLDIIKDMAYPAVLDFGCKSGEFWDFLTPLADTFGCDLALHPKMKDRLARHPEQFRISHHPHTVPYEDSTFDLVFANSVFEHVEPLPAIVRECARVLKPGGRLIAIFPTKSVILEPHVRVPFASRLRPGSARRAWLRAAYCLGFGKAYSARHGGAVAASKHAEAYLSDATFYRPYPYHVNLLRQHFATVEDRTHVLLRAAGFPILPGLAPLVSRYYAVFFDARKNPTE